MYHPKATILAHSISSITGKQIVTLEVEFWRGVLAEFNTHNALSKNTSSSRAIPVPTMLKQVREAPGGPSRFGAANTGMQDKGEHSALVNILGTYRADWMPDTDVTPHDAWMMAADDAAHWAEAFHEAGYAKQVCNRLIEAYQTVKMVVTATDLENFFWLRDHYMADPSIDALAKEMKKVYLDSDPVELNPGEWHTPYYGDGFWKKDGFQSAGCEVARDRHKVTLEDALAISASCCAQASYRKMDDTLEKAKGVVSRLNLGVDLTEPCHASPTEHQGTPIAATVAWDSDKPWSDASNEPMFPDTWQDGITHMMRDGTFGSGNLKGFVQYRQLIPGNVYTGEIK